MLKESYCVQVYNYVNLDVCKSLWNVLEGSLAASHEKLSYVAMIYWCISVYSFA